ncbi:MAG: AzlC family ABC transporter permease [Sphaerochaetaceae bacterium]|jgi:4-azaleucine resistance transporter AzlC|nr:AzlC family ABC transporter permease [Sphaerochaetaceae bacterium]
MPVSAQSQKAFKAAFRSTLPIMAGFLFLGSGYGLYMRSLGLEPWWPMLTSLLIYAGSMEFVTARLLLGAFDPIGAFLMTLAVNSRHVFYGLALLDSYQVPQKQYLIFGLCDETFSINSSAKVDEDINRGLFYTWVTALNQLYWLAGSTIGAFLWGLVSRVELKGLDFVCTALFAVIFLDSFLKEKSHASSTLGIVLSGACLFILGDGFILPALFLIVLALMLLHKPLGRFYEHD